jgi:hypothetical protein
MIQMPRLRANAGTYFCCSADIIQPVGYWAN